MTPEGKGVSEDKTGWPNSETVCHHVTHKEGKTFLGTLCPEPVRDLGSKDLSVGRSPRHLNFGEHMLNVVWRAKKTEAVELKGRVLLLQPSHHCRGT